MNIFFSHKNPFLAAKMLPENRQARMLQEACQMLCKGLNLKPFMRPTHIPQGNDLSTFIAKNPAYCRWVCNYIKSLIYLRSQREGAELVLNAAKVLSTNVVEPITEYPQEVVVRLPKEFVEITGYLPRSILPVEKATTIYQELLQFKYGVKI